MNKKRLLVLGATAAMRYVFETSRKMGVYTYAVDANPNSIGFKYADEYSVIDIFDYNNLEKYVRKNRIDGIIGFGLDIIVYPTAVLTERLGLPGMKPEVAKIGTNKALMKKKFVEHGVNTPMFFVVSNIEEFYEAVSKLKYPSIVKPTDNAAKRGVTFITKDSDMQMAFDYAMLYSREGKVIIEEYIEGKLLFAQTFVINDKYHVAIMDQEYLPNLIQVKFIAPSLDYESIKNKIESIACKCAQSIGLKSGGLHTEIIIDKQGEPYIIETSPRVSYATVALSRLVYSFDPVEKLILLALNEVPLITYNLPTGFGVLQHLLPQPGSVFNVNSIQNILIDPLIKELNFFINNGAVVNEFKTNSDRVGYFVAYSQNDLPMLNEFVVRTKLELENKLFHPGLK